MAVTIFKDSRFRGRRVTLDKGEYPRIPIGNDALSSLKIKPGFFVKLYKHTGFRGPRVVLFAGDYSFVHNWNDEFSSMEVLEHDPELFPLISFYEHKNFKGYRQNLGGLGKITGFNTPFFKNDSITSMKVPEGTSVILYKDSQFRGSSREFKAGNYNNLGTFGFNDKTSSVQILRPDLELVGIEYKNIVTVPTGGTFALFDDTVNDTDLPQTTTLTLENEISKTITRSFSRSTLFGITVSSTATVGVSRGPVSAEVSTTVSTTLENTFTVGEEESKAETTTFSKDITLTIPPRSIGEVTMLLKPQKTTLDAIYTFRLKGTEKKFQQEVKIEIDDVQKGEAVISPFRHVTR